MKNRPGTGGRRFVHLAAAISALGVMLLGYDIGVISGAIQKSAAKQKGHWAALLRPHLIAALSSLAFTEVLGKAGTFWLYGAISTGTGIFSFFLVPETKGNSLERIEAHWRAGKQPRALSGRY